MVRKMSNGKNTKHSLIRAFSWWLEWEDLQWPAPEIKAKIKKRALAAASGESNLAIIFGAHFRWDFLPIFDRLHGLINEIKEALAEYDIIQLLLSIVLEIIQIEKISYFATGIICRFIQMPQPRERFRLTTVYSINGVCVMLRIIQSSIIHAILMNSSA
jgi:hypothetical protein